MNSSESTCKLYGEGVYNVVITCAQSHCLYQSNKICLIQNYDNIRRTVFIILRLFGEIDLNIILYGYRTFMSYILFYVCFSHSGVPHILCCVFVLFFFVLCAICCQYLWIVHFNCPFDIFSNAYFSESNRDNFRAVQVFLK